MAEQRYQAVLAVMRRVVGVAGRREGGVSRQTLHAPLRNGYIIIEGRKRTPVARSGVGRGWSGRVAARYQVIALRGFRTLPVVRRRDHRRANRPSDSCRSVAQADSGCWLIGRFVLRERRSHISSCGSQREILDLPLCGVSRHPRGPNPRLGFGFS